MIAYHDSEWGTPNHNDQKLFEFMVLDAMQAGLSWQIVLNKRAGFEKALNGFDIKQVARLTEADVERLMNDLSIIRNRAKLKATITNAQKVLEIQKEFGSLDKYLWGFVGGETITNSPKHDSHIAATSPKGDAMSKDLVIRGFKFVGPTICHAFMQGAGMVNDHLVSCFRYRELVAA